MFSHIKITMQRSVLHSILYASSAAAAQVLDETRFKNFLKNLTILLREIWIKFVRLNEITYNIRITTENQPLHYWWSGDPLRRVSAGDDGSSLQNHYDLNVEMCFSARACNRWFTIILFVVSYIMNHPRNHRRSDECIIIIIITIT